jgi:hypothetical protein
MVCPQRVADCFPRQFQQSIIRFKGPPPAGWGWFGFASVLRASIVVPASLFHTGAEAIAKSRNLSNRFALTKQNASPGTS